MTYFWLLSLKKYIYLICEIKKISVWNSDIKKQANNVFNKYMPKNICKCIIYYCITKYICDILGSVSPNYTKFSSSHIPNNNLYKLTKVPYNIRNKAWHYNWLLHIVCTLSLYCCVIFYFLFSTNLLSKSKINIIKIIMFLF